MRRFNGFTCSINKTESDFMRNSMEQYIKNQELFMNYELLKSPNDSLKQYLIQNMELYGIHLHFTHLIEDGKIPKTTKFYFLSPWSFEERKAKNMNIGYIESQEIILLKLTEKTHELVEKGAFWVVDVFVADEIVKKIKEFATKEEIEPLKVIFFV